MRILKYIVTAALSICLVFTISILGLFIFADGGKGGEKLLINGNTLAAPWITEADEQRPKDKPVIGSLGGLSVMIPPGVARHVEYDGDPGWGEKRQGPKPIRNYQSVLRSFAFDARFPGMESTASEEMKQDKKSFNIYNTPWLLVGVSAGSDFGDGGFFERYYQTVLMDVTRGNLRRVGYKYGLEYFEPSNIKNPKHYKYYFFLKDSNNNIVQSIDCAVVNHEAAPCEQHFFMEKMNRVKVSVVYRIGMLPNWMDINKMVSEKLLDFNLINLSED